MLEKGQKTALLVFRPRRLENMCVFRLYCNHAGPTGWPAFPHLFSILLNYQKIVFSFSIENSFFSFYIEKEFS